MTPKKHVSTDRLELVTLDVTRDEILSICNALNVEAKYFDNLIQTQVATAGTLKVWVQKAAENRALSRRLVAYSSSQRRAS